MQIFYCIIFEFKSSMQNQQLLVGIQLKINCKQNVQNTALKSGKQEGTQDLLNSGAEVCQFSTLISERRTLI